MSGEDSADARARVAWAATVEYPDPAAAWLVAALGPQASWSAACSAAGLSDQRVRRLVESELGDALRASGGTDRDVEGLVQAFSRWAPRIAVTDADDLLHRTRAVSARVIVPGSTEWPSAMDDLGSHAPFALWVAGSAELAEAMADAVAVVGARSATAYGSHTAAHVGAGLADRGHCVVSGGAYGIDSRAHAGALGAGGSTVAFLASGVDRLYPAGNADLLTRIRDSGALVSQVPPGSSPYRSRFLSRNRLIAAAGATVVVEAAHRSGALNTARHAAELARPVGAVPGPVTSAASAGCHRLIREGAAVLVTSVDEVVELVLPPDASLLAEEEIQGGFPSAHARRVYDVLAVARDASSIAKESGLTLGETLAALGALEASGLAGVANGSWRRTGHYGQEKSR